MNRKKRFGDRKDGYLIRTLDPISKVSPYIMKTRCGSMNLINMTIDIDEVDDYLREKRKNGFKNISMLHFMIATYIRTASQMPGINRFVNGQKIYARYGIEICLAVKKELVLNAPETIVKCKFTPDCTLEDVYNILNAKIEEYKNNDDQNKFDNTAKILNYIPGLFLRFSIGFLSFLDYFGLLPKSLTDVSPFHGSFFITSMGSLGIPAIFHHLYDFGNLPVFCAYGAKKSVYQLSSAGEPEEKRCMDFSFALDERICDGQYYASCMKFIKKIFKNPAILDKKPEQIVPDID